MCNAYNLELKSYYPKKGFVARPKIRTMNSVLVNLTSQLNGRTTACGYIAKPKSQSVPPVIKQRRKRLNGRTKSFGYVAVPGQS
jgi:hypothetical protein